MSITERIDPVVFMLVGASIMIFAYLMTWQDQHPELAQKSMTLLVFALIGIMGRFVWWFLFNQPIRVVPSVSIGRTIVVAAGALGLVIAAAGMWSVIKGEMISQGSVAFLAGTTITVERAWYVLAAISEECFFTWGIMLGGIAILSNRKLIIGDHIPIPAGLIALLGSSFLFAIWHTAVYQTGEVLQLMFVYRALFGSSYLISGYIGGERSIAMAVLAHMTINYIAV